MARREEIAASAMARKRQRLSTITTAGNAASLSANRGEQDDDEDERERERSHNPEGEEDAPDETRLAFADETTADVVVHLFGDDKEFLVSLHSAALSKSRYFAALLSERWKGDEGGSNVVPGDDQEHGRSLSSSSSSSSSRAKTHLKITITSPVAAYVTVLKLFYKENFSEVIVDVQSALLLLPVAAELLYDECMSCCLKFLEAVPWSKEEEKQILQVLSYLQLEETPDIIARVIPSGENTAVETMLSELVYAATHNHQNAACVKLFVGKILDSHKSRETVRLVLDNAFKNGLKTVKDSVEEYSSPNVRGRHDEIEAIQRQNLHTAVVSGRHLLWLVERMIELKVAENAVLEWSEQSSFTANLKRAFMDDVWRNNVPGLPAVLLRCTFRLAHAMVSGAILVSRDVRKKMVRDWLPVLITSKENAVSANCNKQLHQNLEEVFLKLISTLPVADAQELLQQCLCFASRGLDDSSHLAMAFGTWFRRASGGDN